SALLYTVHTLIYPLSLHDALPIYPPSYFEGLMSVGEDVDKIEVLSRKEDGNLLFFNNDLSYTSNGITYTVDAKTQVITVNGTCRSEEHTSELQSRFDLVCRLLLEK